MIIRIIVPNNNQAERSYILSVLFTDFLGLEYQVEFDDEAVNYNIVIGEKILIIKDDFFGKYRDALSYLNIENIPQTLSWFDAKSLQKTSLPIIYGENTLKIEEDTVFCGLDIFASAFFMLSRWEEIVIPKKDIHGRCDENEMFVVKHNLYKRAIVNEYVELLKDLLALLNGNLQYKKYQFEILFTHDIDVLFRFDIKNLIKTLGGDLILRKNLLYPFKTLLTYWKFKTKKIKDPFDTFDEFMDLSEKVRVKSAFYFKPSLNNEFDATYSIFDTRVKKIMQNITSRGHEVGIHPSKNTFHNGRQMDVEVQRIKSLNLDIKGGRQHFLLYDVEDSFDFWEQNNLSYDTGLGFYARAGFRCGVCYPYFMFDIRKRRKRMFIQKPLIVMEGALMGNFTIEPKELSLQILEFVTEVEKYDGLFVLLWHNNQFYSYETAPYKETYYSLIDFLAKKN